MFQTTNQLLYRLDPHFGKGYLSTLGAISRVGQRPERCPSLALQDLSYVHRDCLKLAPSLGKPVVSAKRRATGTKTNQSRFETTQNQVGMNLGMVYIGR